MMNKRQMEETFKRRSGVITAYCKKKGWNDQKITLEQRKEIRNSSEWKSIIPTIMEGY